MKSISTAAAGILLSSKPSAAEEQNSRTTSAVAETRKVPDLRLENREKDKRTFTVVAINKQGRTTFRQTHTLAGGESKKIPTVFSTQAAHALTIFLDDGRIGTINASSTARVPDRYGVVASVVKNRIDIFDRHQDNNGGGK